MQQDFIKAYGNSVPRHWGEKLPGVIRNIPVPQDGPKILFLTMDACGGRKGSGVDRNILDLLRKEGIPAVIFVTSGWLRANIALARELAADPLFELAAHGARHKPASVTGRSAYGIKGCESVGALVEEVVSNVQTITELTGRKPIWYRSGTAFYDDVAVKIIHDIGLRIAGFTVSLDEGGTLPADKVAERVRRAASGSILLCHLNRPKSGTGQGLAAALPKLKEDGAVFLWLTDD